MFAVADEPPYDASAMDGFAVRAIDVRDATTHEPIRLRLVGESRAGRGFDGVVGPGEAIRISTGARLPAGADAIVIREDARVDGEVIFAGHASPVGHHVRGKGREREAGALVARRGCVIDCADVSAIAAADHGSVRVARRARVAVLSTGDELRWPGTAARIDSIVGSNAHLLDALVAREGAHGTVLEFVPDHVDTLVRRLDEAANGHDVVVSTGGASVGDHDGLHAALAALDVTLVVDKVRMKPGKPVIAGAFRSGVPIVALPGNPLAAFVGFELFVAPLLRAMAGARSPFPELRRLALETPLRRTPGRPELARARITPEGFLRFASVQGSAAQRSMQGATHLAYLPADRDAFDAGELLAAWPIGGSDERNESPFPAP